MIPTLLDAGCNISNDTSLQTCLCLNGTAERIITDCIVSSCEFLEHIESENVQQALCEGQPYPTRQPELLFATIFLSCLVIICVVVRCWSRHIVLGEYWWDDWLILIATVSQRSCIIFMTILNFSGVFPYVTGTYSMGLVLCFYVTILSSQCTQVLRKDLDFMSGMPKSSP
jgi:hypothetical protein